ncbi:hypothetical protein ACH474_33915 [Nocardia rhamnosiphila]|nr:MULTISPECIES: hypothetical protein [Nocardia]MCX0271228.1 hypothetical protein [Nocardia zapadnayensis]
MRKSIPGHYISLDDGSARVDHGIRDTRMSIVRPEQEQPIRTSEQVAQ